MFSSRQMSDDDGRAPGAGLTSSSTTAAAAHHFHATIAEPSAGPTPPHGHEGSSAAPGLAAAAIPTGIPLTTGAAAATYEAGLVSSARLPASPPVSPPDHLHAVTPLAYVAPSHLLRPARRQPLVRQESYEQSMTTVDKEQVDGLRAIRVFLKTRTAYDVLPLSYRTIVFDTSLMVKKSLNVLTQCAIVSAPLWDSKSSTFAGMLTISDYLNVVQYYCQHPESLHKIDQFRLSSLRDIERAIGVSPIETVSTHPLTSLFETCRGMLASRARRIPLVDRDDETKRPMVVAVITQYRILKFMTINMLSQTQMLRKPLRDLKIGTYADLATCTMDDSVLDVINELVKRNISCVPILGEGGVVLNVFEAVDVIPLIKGGDYDSLEISVGHALSKRPEDFPGIYTCTLNDHLDAIFETIRRARVHRLIIIDDTKQLRGVLALSDILDYTLNSPLPE